MHKFKVGDKVRDKTALFDYWGYGVVERLDDQQTAILYVLMKNHVVRAFKKDLIYVAEPWEIWKKLIAELEI